MSVQTIYAHKTIGITDLKRNGSIIDFIDEPIAILKRDSVKANGTKLSCIFIESPCVL